MQRDDRDLTEADRRAIAEIRRELDAEFGPLEDVRPLAGTARRAAARPSEQIAERALRRMTRPRRRALSTFLLGALVGGLAGGVAGGVTAVWLGGADHDLARWLSRVAPDGAASTDGPVAASPRAEHRVTLEAALSDWLEATRRGDIQGQMRFYPARVPVYYTWRDVPRQAVREEKLEVFGAATRLEIATDTPVVQLTDGGRSAVTRFRKRYVIEGPVIRRRGEVVQELRWARTSDGWRIVAERDAEVLAASPPRGSR